MTATIVMSWGDAQAVIQETTEYSTIPLTGAWPCPDTSTTGRRYVLNV